MNDARTLPKLLIVEDDAGLQRQLPATVIKLCE